MLLDQFKKICKTARKGSHTYVLNPVEHETGIVKSCVEGDECLVVKVDGGEIKCWDYRECLELRNTVS